MSERSTATAGSRIGAVTAGLLATWLLPAALCRAAPPSFTGDAERSSNNGAVLLETDLEPGEPLVVQMDRDPAFPTPHVEYDGRLSSAYVSGLDDGTYFFRARHGGTSGAAATEWSSTVTLTVAHHPMSRVWPVLGVGSLLFLATLGVLVHGAVQEARERSDEPGEEATA